MMLHQVPQVQALPVASLTLLWPFLWLDNADLSDHGSVIVLQVCLDQWQSFTRMEHGTPHKRAVDMATGLVRKVTGCKNW